MTIRSRDGGDSPGGIPECGCCGSRLFPKRSRIWFRVGERHHGEICAECILKGPAGAAAVLRERIRKSRLNPGGSWERWLEDRARFLESMESFPLAARQAATREMRERR